MKRVIWVLTLLVMSFSVFAQNADSVALASAFRQKWKVKGAECYTVSVNLFNSPQTISVVKVSSKDFVMKVVQPGDVAKISEMAEPTPAEFAINACFWAVKAGIATTFVKSDGDILSFSNEAGLPRVNGLLFMYEDGIEVVTSTEMPDYASLDDKVNGCKNIIACGPVLLDNGVKQSYKHIIDSTDESLKRKKPFYIRRHPRSAVGCDAEGNLYFVTVDGRAKGEALGATIAELTNICAWLGMTEALNLDGGGSASLWSRKYGTISHPCDNRKFDHEGERRVSSALLLLKK